MRSKSSPGAHAIRLLASVAASGSLLLAFTGQSQLFAATASALLPPPTRIAVYADAGAEPKATLALFRMLAALGAEPQAIVAFDIKHDRLTAGNFDIFVLPAGQDGGDAQYALDLAGSEGKIRAFVSAGGGFIGIEAGARYAATTQNWNGALIDRPLDLYPGVATGPIAEIGDGMGQIEIADPAFATAECAGGVCTIRYSPGAAWFAPAGGTTTVATVKLGTQSGADGAPGIVRFGYGAGRAVLVAPSLELEENSERDWTEWDNLDASGYDAESDWPLMGRLLEWIVTGSVQNATRPNSTPNLGKRFAVYTKRDVDGGSWPGLLPPLARAIENAGDTPLSVRDTEIKSGALAFGVPTAAGGFDALVMPGGYAFGYARQLNGYEPAIRGFINAGGGYVGISAGSFYEADRIIWHPFHPTNTINYPLNLYGSIVEGDFADIAAWPAWNLTPVAFSDPLIWTGNLTGLYWGEGYYHEGGIPALTVSGRLAYGGVYDGTAVTIRHSFGSGRVFSPNLHFEVEEGSTRDWAFFDNWRYDSVLPQSDPESDWGMLANGFNWVAMAGSSTPPESFVAQLGVRKTPTDTTGDTLADAQRKDASGASPAPASANDGWYTVGGGQVSELTGFGRSVFGPLASATLEAKYSVRPGSNANSFIQWSLDGANYQNTTIRPVNGAVDITASFNLFAAGVNSWSALQSLRVRYANNDTGGRGVSFDSERLIVTYLPAEISPSAADEPLVFSDRTTLRWQDAGTNGAFRFNLYRGSLDQLPQGNYGTCLQSGLSTNTAVVAATPPVGTGWFYLVTGVTSQGEGTMGARSDGTARLNSSPCP